MIPIKPVTITAPKPQLNSREDYSNLKSFSDSYARGDIKYLDIPYKYRVHIKEDIHTARDKFDKAVQAEKDRYENSNTGKFTNFMGQVVTAPLALPVAEITSPIIGDVSEPVIQAGKKYIVEPAKQYLSTHPTVAKWASAGRTALDLGGIGLGLWHFTSPNGYEKTARKFNEGNLPGALVSAAGDALDLTGFLGLTDLGMRGYRGVKEAALLRRRKPFLQSEPVSDVTNPLILESPKTTSNVNMSNPRPNYTHTQSNPSVSNENSIWKEWPAELIPKDAKEAIIGRIARRPDRLPEVSRDYIMHANLYGWTPDQYAMFKGYNFTELPDDVFRTMRSDAIFEQRRKYPDLWFRDDQTHLFIVPTEEYRSVVAPLSDQFAQLQRLRSKGLSLDEVSAVESQEKTIMSAIQHLRQAIDERKALTPAQINEISEVYKQFGLEIPKELFMNPAERGMTQMRAIIKDLPRGSAITEANTSTDSELMKWVVLNRMHGTSPSTLRGILANITRRNGMSKHRLHESDYGLPKGSLWNELSPELQARITADATARANETIGKFKRFVQMAIDNGAISLPAGKSIDDLFYYQFQDPSLHPSTSTYMNPDFYTPTLFLHKNKKGGTIKNPKYYKWLT